MINGEKCEYGGQCENIATRVVGEGHEDFYLCDAHYPLTCEGCGKDIDIEAFDDDCGFELNKKYPICVDCQKRQQENGDKDEVYGKHPALPILST